MIAEQRLRLFNRMGEFLAYEVALQKSQDELKRCQDLLKRLLESK